MALIIKENFQLLALLCIWFLVGSRGGPIALAFIPLTVLLLKRRDLLPEMLIGFLFILILSDNLEPATAFAKGVKNIYIVLLAGLFILNRKRFSPVNHFVQGFLPYFILSFILLYYSETFNVSLQKTLSYVLLFITVPNYISTIYRERGPAFFKQLLLFMVAIVILSIALKYVFPLWGISHEGRLRGIFGNPNGLGIFCVLTFVFSQLIFNYYPHLFTKREQLVIAGIFFLAIYWSGSRNALVSALLFLMFSRIYNVSAHLGFLVFLIVVFLYIVIGVNYVAIIQYLGLQSYFRIETLEEGGGRYIAWNFAWEEIQKNFFLGKGFAYDEYLMRKNFDRLSKLGHQGGVHNTYLIIWLNTGLVGLLLFFKSFISVFIKGAKNTTLAFPIMYAIMFTIIFEPWLAASLNPFTILFLIMGTIITGPEFKIIPATEEASDDKEMVLA